MTSFPNLLVVRRDFPANTMAEFIAYASKARTPARSTTPRKDPERRRIWTGERPARATGTQLVHVPYRGTAQAMNDLIASHVDMMFLELSVAYEQITSKRVKVLGVAAKERVAALPDVPTLEEAGLKDFVSYAWNALAAPPKTPKPVIAKFNAAVNEIFRMPDMVEHFKQMKMNAVGGTPEQMAEFLAVERQRWGEVIEAAHVTVNQRCRRRQRRCAIAILILDVLRRGQRRASCWRSPRHRRARGAFRGRLAGPHLAAVGPERRGAGTASRPIARKQLYYRTYWPRPNSTCVRPIVL